MLCRTTVLLFDFERMRHLVTRKSLGVSYVDARRSTLLCLRCGNDMREVRRGDDVRDDGGVLVREAAARPDAARGDGVLVSKLPGGRDRGAGGEREGPGLKP